MPRGYFQHRGVTFPGLLYSPRGVEAAREFPVEDDDIFNVTYQKSGTVWMLEILSLILSDGDPNWCQSVPNWDRGPWLETELGLRRARRNPRPRLISSHLPIQLFPKAFFSSKAKVIYTVRDPKDVLVSLYHFARIFRPYRDPGELGQFLEQFLAGDVPFGSWFEHVRGWLQLRGRENFLWVSYEELQQDLRGCVQRLCTFLGRVLSATALDAVVANASFTAMSRNPMSNFSLSPFFILDLRRGPFLRKGISGDWRNHLTPEQSARFDRLYQQRMVGLGVTFPWDPPQPPSPTPPTLPGDTQDPTEGEDTPPRAPQDPPEQETPPRTPQDPCKEETPPGPPQGGGDAEQETPPRTPKTPSQTTPEEDTPPRTPQDHPKVEIPPVAPQDPTEDETPPGPP